ncbi:MAG: cell division protein FtsZ [Bacteroidota bacterium]
MFEEMIKFDMPKEQPSIIKVIGVGGGGSNAVNHMYTQGIKGVDFMVCNTDMQALIASPVPAKIQLGEGLGAGAIPEVGRKAALDKIEELKAAIGENTKMVFITAGMGGGTGTGAAPIIAATAKEMGILTVGIVTIPFAFEGKNRRNQADFGISDLKENVDTLLIICNDRIREIYGNLSLKNAFSHADDVLTTAAKGIAEIITGNGYINVDFNDVYTVMHNGGSAIMGHAVAEGENRAIQAVEEALSSPLLNDSNIRGSSQVLLYISSSSDENNMATMDEIGEISDYIQEAAGSSANIIFGTGFDESLGNKLSIIVIATGYTSTLPEYGESNQNFQKKVHVLEDTKVEVVQNVQAIVEVKPEDDFKLIVKNTEPEAVVESTIVETIIPQNTIFEVIAPIVNVETPVVINVAEENKIVHTLYDEVAVSQNVIAEVKSEPIQSATTETMVAESNTEFTFKNAQEESDKKEIKEDGIQENKQRSDERIDRLKRMSSVLKQKNINDLINEPAYKRKEINLDPTPHSSESHVSKYTLTENDGKIEMKENNSFLHDNVD